jgi:hypothetical protein
MASPPRLQMGPWDLPEGGATMKLAYPIPHRVTCRMVGAMFVASCTCKKWAAQADPHRYDGTMAEWLTSFVGTPVSDLIAAGHKHATDHVLERQGIAREVAA